MEKQKQPISKKRKRKRSYTSRRVRRYSDKEKGEILAIVEIQGWDIKGVAEDLGVGSYSIYRWLAESDRYEKYLTAKKREFAARIDEVIEKILNRMLEVIPDSTKLSELATTLGIAYDKRALATGDVTARTESEEKSLGLSQIEVKGQIAHVTRDIRKLVHQAERVAGIVEAGSGGEGTN
jgi:transposase-like protein